MNQEIYEIMDEAVSALENLIEDCEDVIELRNVVLRLTERKVIAEKAREFLDKF